MRNSGGISAAVRVLVMLVLSAAVFLVFLEVSARLLLSSKEFFARLQGYDSATLRMAWVKRHLAGGGKMDFDFDVHHPVRGWALKPGIRDKSVFGGKGLSSNSRGIRGIKEYSYKKTPGVTRILTIGDSFTFGEEVGDGETFSRYLERIIPDVEVINAGVHGYGHDQILLYLREEGMKYEPDIVILGFLYYDMERNIQSFRDFAKPWFEEKNGGLVLKGTPVPSPQEILDQEWLRLKAFDLWTMTTQRIAWNNGMNKKRMYRISTLLLDEIARTVEAGGAKPVFVYFPNESDFVHFFDKPSDREAFLLDYCRQRTDLICGSVRPIFLKHLKQGYIVDYFGHWDKEGHLMAAYAIRDLLYKNKALPVLSAGKREAQNA